MTWSSQTEIISYLLHKKQPALCLKCFNAIHQCAELPVISMMRRPSSLWRSWWYCALIFRSFDTTCFMSAFHQPVPRIMFMWLLLIWDFFFTFHLYLFAMNWTCCVSYGFHNAVLHSSSWHRLCLTAASALSLTLFFLLSFLSLTHPLIMQSQQKAAPPLSLGFPDTE